MLQKDNNGVFPFGKVYDTIDGQQLAAAHGTRQMPIWGNYFNESRSVPSGRWVTRGPTYLNGTLR